MCWHLAQYTTKPFVFQDNNFIMCFNFNFQMRKKKVKSYRKFQVNGFGDAFFTDIGKILNYHIFMLYFYQNNFRYV